MFARTPMHVMRDIAEQYGQVDRTDMEAVYRFYEEGIFTLPRFTQLRIVATLIKRKDEAATEEDYEETDEDVPLPNAANYVRADVRRRRKTF